MKSIDLKNRLPSFWTIQLTGWTVYFVVIYITFLSIAQPENFVSLLLLKGFRALTGFFLSSIFLRPIYKRFADRFSILGLVLLVLSCVVILGLAWTAIELGYFILTSPAFDTAKYLPRTPRVALDYTMTLSAWSAFYLGVKNWWSWQRERENSLQSSASANQAQLEMLRYQLNPHFLFNALNSIRASVDDDATRAKEMITQMSEFLRYSLLGKGDSLVPLREELEATQNYLAIEKIRFEDKLEIEFDIGKAAEDFRLPCFLLNPLVENAIKHGLQTSSGPLLIKITAQMIGKRFILEVSNSGTLNDSAGTNGTGIGLRNVRERVERMFGARGVFELKQDNGFVTARIEIVDEV